MDRGAGCPIPRGQLSPVRGTAAARPVSTPAPQAPPAWTEEQVVRYLGDNYRRFEALLPLGPFQHLLPLHLRRRAVVEQFDVVGFLAAVAALRPLAAPEGLAEDLTALLAD